ncbi:protein NEDD1 [Entomortierella parvispora]|uniref:Protein NEDD1 n=1 Tax=Entomortierella parvispora TaxID=205924 RepID=A0A9P3H8A7_9FUNG|nr:protein NEDD1 [Entomortierella parvispora]
MEPSQPPRLLGQRKRSYSTTAYSSQEEEAALGHTNMKAGVSSSSIGNGFSSSNAQPTCLLAAAVGPHVISYEFINTGSVLPTAAPAGAKQQPPIAVPGQYEGIQMSNELTGYTTASLKWSPDNSILAIETLDGRTLLHDNRGRFKESLITEAATTASRAGIHRCAMSWAPKPMRLYFANGPKVLTWDSTLKRVSETFETGSRICSLAINTDDILLAVGQNTGSLDVVNRSTGISQKMDKPNTLVMAKLEYSAFNKSILGGVGNDGVLRLWDSGSSGTSSIYHSFNTTHEGSISGMAFSPFNRYLICTTGMDKSYALYDVEKKNVVKTTVTDYSLTSVSFKNDGISMAFGTAEGKVLLYDLRSASKPITIVDTKIKSPVSAIHFQGKHASTGMRRHQTINGHALKRQNSEGSKPSILSKESPLISQSQPAMSTPLSILSTAGTTGTEEQSKYTKPTFTRPGPIKTSTNMPASSSHPALSRLSANSAKPTREIQSAGVSGRGFSEFFSVSKKPAISVDSDRAPLRPRRPTAPSSTVAPEIAAAPSANTVPAVTTRTHGSVPTTPKREGSGTQTGGSYPNSRTVSPFSFQVMQSRSPSGESSSSSSSVNTPPGSPGHAAAQSSQGESHRSHHHYQYPSASSLSRASPSQSSRAKRRKSLGTLLASGGAVSPAPTVLDPMADEKMEILKGQIVEKVRDVFLDHESLQGSKKHGSEPPHTSLSAQSIRAPPVKDLWMRIGLENPGEHDSATTSRSKSKPDTLGQSVLPATSSSLDVVPPPTSSFSSKILEGVIEGCLMDFRAGIRSDIQNMHLELLRQFQIQKMEIEGLLKEYTDLKDVREENERLIEENRRLRLNY